MKNQSELPLEFGLNTVLKYCMANLLLKQSLVEQLHDR